LNKNIVTNKDWVKPYCENGALKVKERSVINSLVPDVKGLGVKDALFLLENQGLKVKIVGRQVGKVRRQSINPGVKARSGLIIELVVS
jgi:cell division protein FtsI (penicillin-binding protein 3)